MDQNTSPIFELAEFGDAFGAAVAHGDFNCDGFQDLAVGTPEENHLAVDDAGLVIVIYGSASGLDLSTSENYSQAIAGLSGGPVGANHRFGASLAAGNFDGNSVLGIPCDDLAVGVPGLVPPADLDNAPSGGVIILPGVHTGLSTVGSRHFGSAIFGIEGQPGDAFGYALAAGDFNGDGKDDLAIGGPGMDVAGKGDAGRVFLIGGSDFGLSPADAPFLDHMSQSFFSASVETGDAFGRVLAAGDFDRSGGPNFDDLAIGTPTEDLERPGGTTLEDAGAVFVAYGSASGINSAGDQIFTQDDLFISGSAVPFNLFGAALTIGDFDGDEADDLAIGSPGVQQAQNPGRGLGVTLGNVGQVHVLYGAAGLGITIVGDAILRRSDFYGTFEADDEFGFSLAAADFDRDGLDELAIGTPGATVQGAAGAGLVHILRGVDHFGLFDAGPTLFQDGESLGSVEAGDNFGWALTAGDFDADGAPDLAVGTPIEETVNGINGAGAVNVFYSSQLFADGFESADTTAWATVVD